jgi:hypothetical protein
VAALRAGVATDEQRARLASDPGLPTELQVNLSKDRCRGDDD